MQEQPEARQEQQQGGEWRCPVCGEPGWHTHGGMKGKGPWGKGYMGPWGGHMHYPGPWMMGPRAGMCMGIVPALVGFALGYMIATARMSAWFALSEGKCKR